VRAFEEDKLYGLQFYRGGALRRVSARAAPWADERLDEALDAIRRGRERPHVLVASARAAPALEAALAAAALPYRRVRAASRELFVIAPEDAPPPAPPR
jgi:hypothetical protein